jgi:hypothetical protein
MRRLLGLVVSAVLVVAVFGLAPSAHAGGSPDRSTYHSVGLSTSWEERHRISDDAYERVNWYVNGYLSREGGDERFRAYVSRYDYLCKRRQDRPNRFRCSLVTRMTGIERDLADVTFSVDKDLGDAALAGDFQLRQLEHHEVVAVKSVHLSAQLVGRGELYRSKDSYTNWDGNCPESRYRFEYRYRRGLASVSITGDFSASLEGLRRAWMSDQDGFVLRRDCG